MKKTFTRFMAALALLTFLAVPMGMRGQATYEQLTSIANIDENAQYVLGIDGTGFHYSGTSSWGLTALPSAQTPIYYTLTKASDGNSFTAQATIDNTTYYLQVHNSSNTFSMATSAGTDTDLIIGTTQVSGTNYAVANKTTTARHLRINGTSGLRSYAGTTGNMAFFYKVIPATPAYTIIAQSNNDSYGTVSLSGSVITGSPNSGYRYADPAYTVSPANSATVSQNGNEFTVTPSANTTVTINFEAIPTHTATFSVNGATTSQSFLEGAAIVFPSDPANISGKKFVGWVTETIAEPTDEEPSFVNTATETMGSSNVTYYAVFATATASGDPVETKTQTLQYDTWTHGGSSTDKPNNSYRLFHDGGYVESSSFDLSKLSKVIVYGGTFGGDSYNSLTLGDGTNTWKNVTVSGSSQTGSNTYTGGTALTGTKALRVTSTCGSSSGNGSGVRMSKVEIYTMEPSYTYSGYCTSIVVTVVETPVISPVSGIVASGTKVTITCATDGASIYYTTDSSTPSSSSTVYDPSSKPTITAATTIKAIAVKDGLTDSEVVSASYTIAEPCATPTFSVAAGEVAKGTSVTISTETDGATIYYTTDNTDPTTSSSTYSSAITINTAMIIKAIAVKEGNLPSEVASVSYTVIDYATLPFAWTGGTNSSGGSSSDLTAMTGVTANGLGSDYAQSNAPYRIKFDTQGDFIQIKTNSQPAKVSIAVKMLGGATTSKIKVQESANGTDYTDVEEFTISGSQNDILSFATSSFNATTRYVRIIKSVHGSNVGVGPITVYKLNTIASNTTWTADDFTPEANNVYVVSSGSSLTLSGDFSTALNDPAKLIIEDGGQLICNNTVEATVEKSIAAATDWGTASNGWYFIASPLVANTDPEDVVNMTGDVSTFDLYRYNDVAANNLAWENYNNATHTSGFKLVNGQGYLYANVATKTLEFTGEIKPYTTAGEANKITIGPGFNLIGNPYTFATYINKPYYKLNAEGNTILASEVKNVAINPCTGVIVNGGVSGYDIFFTETSQEIEAVNPGNIQMALAQTVATRDSENTETIDNAIVSFNEGSELPKLYFGTQNANIYIPLDNEEYAIVSSNAQGEMPVNFRAYVAGEYTITVNPEEVEMGYLHLIDNIAGVDVDLLALRPFEGPQGPQAQGPASYTFTAKADDYESRFRLVFSANMTNAEMGEDFAFISDGQLVIANEGEATLQVIDVTGRVVATENINGTCSKAINAKAGVYVLRLINGTDVKTQKVVIR